MTGTAATARNGDVELAYERLGGDGSEPLLLIMGLGMQMVFWNDGLIDAFVQAGFSPARFDNRDVGESTHLTRRGAPSMAAVMLMPHVVAPYRISDMAADAVAVLNALSWDSAHVLGTSMGGTRGRPSTQQEPTNTRLRPRAAAW